MPWTRPYTDRVGGFLPQPGYSYGGTPAWDQLFTIYNGSNPFGSTGPVLAIYDDGRNGSSGTTIANGTTPVAGFATWLNNYGTGGINCLWKGSNRSGTGYAIRLLDNEAPGSVGNGFGRKLGVQLGSSGSINQILIAYDEHWHGWNGQSTSNGGGYFKHDWATLGGNTVNAFNMVIGDFNDFNSPGTVSLGFDTNDHPPLPNWDFQSNAGTFYDQNGWNSLRKGYIGDASSPTVNAGLEFFQLFNAPNGRALDKSISTNVLFDSSSGSAGTYSGFDHLLFNGLMQDFGVNTIDRTNIYIAVGQFAARGFFIGDSPTLANCRVLSHATVDSTNDPGTLWSAGTVRMRLRQGGFISPAGNYLYRSDEANNISLVGQFT